VFSPIFLSLDFSQGLNFDEYLGQKYSKPSVAISIFLLALLSIFNIKYLINKKEIMILFILTTIYAIANVKYGTTRALILYVGMFLPIISYYVFSNIFQKHTRVYDKMYIALTVIIIIKLLVDIYLTYITYIDLNIKVSFLQYITKKFIVSNHFIFNSIVIYNFLDYFAFIYYLIVVLSIYNIFNKKMVYWSLFLIVVTSIAVFDTKSRLFIYGIYLIPVLVIFYNVTKFRLETYFYIFMSITLIITLIIGLVDFNITDNSLRARYVHAHKYFEDFTIGSFLIPFANQHRVDSTGSFHNELLEIFSFFGLVSIYYYYIIKSIFVNVNSEYKLISYLLMFIIIIGALIQINISNVYVGIMLGMVLAIISLKDVKNIVK
jgi:hypothetical protein